MDAQVKDETLHPEKLSKALVGLRLGLGHWGRIKCVMALWGSVAHSEPAPTLVRWQLYRSVSSLFPWPMPSTETQKMGNLLFSLTKSH